MDPAHSSSIPWSARPLRELSRLAWPIAVSMLSYSVMTIVDTAFVGRLGAAALAGVGLAGVLCFALLVFGIGLLRAVKVLVSQAVGAGRPGEIDDLLGAGLGIALVFGVAAAALAQLVALVVPVLAASPEAGGFAATYLRIRLLGAPAVLIYVAVREARYGVGDARTPMVATIAANVANIALDYTFLFVLELGVAGAAWATVAANLVEVGVLVALTRGKGFSNLATGLSRVRAVFRVGVPTGLQFLVEVGAFTTLSILIASISEVEMAAHQIALHVIHVGFLPAVAVGEAASVLAGQAVGADRDRLVPRVALAGLSLVLGYGLLCTVIFAASAPHLVWVFTADPLVAAAATSLLYMAAGFQIVDGAQIVARGVLRGTGDVRYAAVVSVGAAWVATPPLAWLLGVRLGLGALGGWIGLTVEVALCGAVLWWRLARGGWRRWAARSRADMPAG